MSSMEKEKPLIEMRIPKIGMRRENVIADSLSLLWWDKMAFISLLYLTVLFIGALVSPTFVGDQLRKVDFASFLLPPSLLGSDGHVFGTDALGRDLFIRILYASRTSLFISGVVVICSGSLGLVLGVIAGYYRGVIDDIIMRSIDVMMAFPGLLLVLVVIFIARPGTDKVILVLVATGWTSYARVARAEALRLREFPYVEVARAIGCGDLYIIFQHIIPNLVGVMSALAALGFVGVIMTESGLSFLGMGVRPPNVSWGLLVAEGRGYLTNAWWLALFPGAAIFVTTTAFSLLSNWVSVVVDPVQRGRLLSKMQREM